MVTVDLRINSSVSTSGVCSLHLGVASIIQLEESSRCPMRGKEGWLKKANQSETRRWFGDGGHGGREG